MSNEEAPDCPQCGGEMTLRTNSSTRERFYGCNSFPDCKGTVPANDDDEDALPSRRYSDKRRWERE